MRKNPLSSVASLPTELQTASGINISTGTMRRKIHEMDFHGQASVRKPQITVHNAKRRLEWCKARHKVWTLEQWERVLWSDKSCFTI